jgi:hypothetical protein
MAAATVGEDHGTLYHLVQSSIWNDDKSNSKAYFPPTYEAVSQGVTPASVI